MRSFELREIYQRDAGEIFPQVIQHDLNIGKNSYGKFSVNALKNNIAKFKHNPNYKIYIWEATDSELKHKTVLACIFMSSAFLIPGYYQVEILLNDSVPAGEQDLIKMLDAFLDKMTVDKSVRALTVQIPTTYNKLYKVFTEQFNLQTNTSINLGNTKTENNNLSFWLFTLDKVSNWLATWVFVPTEIAVFGIYGSEAKISQSTWLNYGDFVEDLGMRSICLELGLTNSEGRIWNSYKETLANYKTDRRVLPASLKTARQQAVEYFQGERRDFDLPLVINSASEFQQKVWQETCKIPYAATVSYEDIAARVLAADYSAKQSGDPNDIKASRQGQTISPNAKHQAAEAKNLSRAVGQALGSNPLCVFIPCQRVIAKDKKLQGYKYDIKIKDWLLNREIFLYSENNSKDFNEHNK